DEKMMKRSRPVAAFTQPARSDGSPDEKRVKLAPGIEYHENQDGSDASPLAGIPSGRRHQLAPLPASLRLGCDQAWREGGVLLFGRRAGVARFALQRCLRPFSGPDRPPGGPV